MRPLQFILLAIGASLLLLAVRRLSKYRLKERYTLGFLFIGLPFLALAIWPDAIGYLAGKLDIPYHTLIILIACAFFLIIILELLTIVSIQDRKIANLAQIVGILMNDPSRERGDDVKVEPTTPSTTGSTIRLKDHR